MSHFLANENIPAYSVKLLRDVGFDVASIAESSRGIDDPTVLARAVREQSIIITFDRDYGELIFRSRLPPPLGVILFRLGSIEPEEPARILIELLNRKDFVVEGMFTVIERGSVRQRTLPK
jgi:predicted nuclease of predicted toxin-antitoxin system